MTSFNINYEDTRIEFIVGLQAKGHPIECQLLIKAEDKKDAQIQYVREIDAHPNVHAEGFDPKGKYQGCSIMATCNSEVVDLFKINKRKQENLFENL